MSKQKNAFMENSEVSEKIGELEQLAIKLLKEKNELVTGYHMSRTNFLRDLNEVELQLIDTNNKIGELRRKYKQVQLRRYHNKLSEDAKKIIIDLRKECESCESKEELTVHHMKPLAEGGTHDLSNLKVLCVKCHKKYHRI